MLGKDGRIYDRHFDYDGDGRLNAFEREMMDDIVFGESADGIDGFDEDEAADESLIEDLEDADLDYDELADMDEDERREAIEEAGLDPDDYDDEF